MALDATLGGSTTNSYVTNAEASVYFEDRMHSSAWDLVVEQDQLLISASRMLDWYVNWKGITASTTQSMLWPRTDAYRPSGVLIEDDELPPEIKIAVFELAFSNITSDRTADDPLAGIGQLQVSSLLIKAGPEKPNQTTAPTIPTHVYKILSDLYNSIGSVRLVRA